MFSVADSVPFVISSPDDGRSRPTLLFRSRARQRGAPLRSGPLQQRVRPGTPPHGVAGSRPFALITVAASGVRRKSISAFDAATSLAPAMIAAEKTTVS